MEDAYQQLTGRVVAGMATDHKQELIPDPLFFLGVGSGQDYVATPIAHAHIQRKATPKCSSDRSRESAGGACTQYVEVSFYSLVHVP